MPGAVHVVALGLAEPAQAEVLDNGIENEPVQRVDVHPRQLATAYPVHRRCITGSPGVGERLPVAVDASFSGHRRRFARHAAAPVDHRAKHIERQGPHCGTPIEPRHSKPSAAAVASRPMDSEAQLSLSSRVVGADPFESRWPTGVLRPDEAPRAWAFHDDRACSGLSPLREDGGWDWGNPPAAQWDVTGASAPPFGGALSHS